MNEGILVACLIFAAIGYLIAASLYFSGKKARNEAENLKHALEAAEARVRVDQTMPKKSSVAQKNASLEQQQKSEKTLQKEKLQSDELVSLRKEVGQLKNQLSQLKQENKDFGVKLKDALHEKEVTIFQLMKDKEQLIATVREAEEKLSAKSLAPQASLSERASKEKPLAPVSSGNNDTAAIELSELKKKLATLERSLKTEKEQGEKLKIERQGLQSELRRWTSAALDSDGKPLEPALFKKWKDRALTARVQYQMMKQLREMSDIKLATYQESVRRLAEFVFASTGSKAPLVQAGENSADRFLAEALYALAQKQKPEKSEQELEAAEKQSS